MPRPPVTGVARRPGSSSRWTMRPSRRSGSPPERLRPAGIAPAVLNAANEQAVAAFREARIGFLGITELVDRVMQETLPSGANRGTG